MNQQNSRIILLMFFIVSHSVNVYCFGAEDDDHEVGQIKCTNRFEYRHQIREKVGSCEQIIKSNPMCGKNFTVAYSLHPCLLYTSPSPRDS